MPRVYTQKAATRKWSTRDKSLPEGVSLGDLKPNYKCGRCRQDITPGEVCACGEASKAVFATPGDASLFHDTHARKGSQ